MATKKPTKKANTGRDRKPTQPPLKARRAAPKAPAPAAGQTWERQTAPNHPWERGELRGGPDMFSLRGSRGRFIARGIPAEWLAAGQSRYVADLFPYRYRFIAEAAR